MRTKKEKMSQAYETLFLANNGTSVFTTLGFLKQIENRIDRVKYWNVCGAASLIIFLKIVGKNYEQIFEILGEFSLTSTLINGSSLIPEAEDKKKKYISEWLSEHLSDSEFFSKDIRFDEIFKKTGIFPSFIVWSRKNKCITVINPETTPRYKLIDAVMASLCYIGVYEEYSCMKDVFSNLFSIDSYPYLHVVGENILYIGNISKFDDSKDTLFEPLAKKVDMFIRQISEHEKYRIDNIFKNMSNDESVKLYSSYRRGKLLHEELLTLFKMGQKQGHAFDEEKDTEVEQKEYIEEVENQG